MQQTLFEIGAVIGATLSGLLALAIVDENFRFWPGKGSWQSLTCYGAGVRRYGRKVARFYDWSHGFALLKQAAREREAAKEARLSVAL